MELENRELHEQLDRIGQWILANESRPGLLNPIRMEQIWFARAVLERMTKDTNLKISAAVHQPFASVGSICVEGDSLEFGNCKWLSRAIALASNAELYPTAAGTVRLVLTFHGLTTPIEKK